jgi:hypothetical protein
VPIAIFCNVLRVTGQAYLDRLAGPQWSESFAHQFVGVVMLVPAFLLILGVCWLLDHLFVDDDADGGDHGARTARSSGDDDVIIVVPRGGVAVAKAQAAGGRATLGGAGTGNATTGSVRLPPRAPDPSCRLQTSDADSGGA